MYYPASSHLISRSPGDKRLIKTLDRELARAYHPSGHGFVEQSLAVWKTGASSAEVDRWMNSYRTAGVVAPYMQVECCEQEQDPTDHLCAVCERPLVGAALTGAVCYRVQLQPQKPAYDPAMQPRRPENFISCRRGDTDVLAADAYYSLMAEGRTAFLDIGEIPVGADAEAVYLRAASSAGCFIALVSEHYFESGFCKKEIAHAARAGSRLIRVNVAPVPAAPNAMPWIDGPNWLNVPGDAAGLDTALETALLRAVQTMPVPGSIADLRREACAFLLEQLTPGELSGVWNRLSWMSEYAPTNSKHENIRLVLQESSGPRLSVLCNALAP